MECWIRKQDHITFYQQVDDFVRTGVVIEEKDIKGTSGAYLVSSNLEIQAGAKKTWYLVAEVAQDRANVSNLIEKISKGEDQLIEALVQDTIVTKRGLEELVCKSDGFQLSADKMNTGRHVSNVMFNIMRGGIFEEGHEVVIDDFLAYLKVINLRIFNEYSSSFDKNQDLTYHQLIEKSEAIGDADLIRITYEYLPLTFSRRHGDPSRPWNKFHIDLKYSNGSKKRSYEGNWRDIFQNWEALAYAYPDYTMGMIFKFLNATTIDGYNPYRVTRQGIDWEIIEPDDPWSYIGYWGDHQIIYLQKLLECANRHNPVTLNKWLSEKVFVYANVPYDIRSYEDILNNHKDTVDFNYDREKEIEARVNEIGADGKLVMVDESLIRATMLEKILVTLLAKLSNFVPEGGIWLNTQRPEWNDANNALVGNGVSMVTLYYMRRFCTFLKETILDVENTFKIHEEVSEFFDSISKEMKFHANKLKSNFSDQERKIFVVQVGHAGSVYRSKAYAGFSGKDSTIDRADNKNFLNLVLGYIDHSIQANKRRDGLYHTYNLLQFEGNTLKLEGLYEMLEGQVAILSSGYLNGKECLEVLDWLKMSKMYREDQYSYCLYPNRNIPHFLMKNEIPAKFAENSKLIQQLKKDSNSHLVIFDNAGLAYFNGQVKNAADIDKRLNDLEDYKELVKVERTEILGVFEQMFDHKSFTGRSGTFFAFEGLGSIYWHMVSKLLNAVQENIRWHLNNLNDEEKSRLVQHYYEIRAGIGINKSPDLYGAFPTDPYSHTPSHKGAQQPGMTGQVKEDVLNRWAELGVEVSNGIVSFNPKFLNLDEFLKDDDKFEYFAIDGHWESLRILKGQLVFTYCQVPIVYQRSEVERIHIQYKSSSTELDGISLRSTDSRELFNRTGKIRSICVYLNL